MRECIRRRGRGLRCALALLRARVPQEGGCGNEEMQNRTQRSSKRAGVFERAQVRGAHVDEEIDPFFPAYPLC